MLTSQCHFDGPPFELMGPLLGPLKPTALLKPMGPLSPWAPGSFSPLPPALSAARKISFFAVLDFNFTVDGQFGIQPSTRRLNLNTALLF